METWNQMHLAVCPSSPCASVTSRHFLRFSEAWDHYKRGSQYLPGKMVGGSEVPS